MATTTYAPSGEVNRGVELRPRVGNQVFGVSTVVAFPAWAPATAYVLSAYGNRLIDEDNDHRSPLPDRTTPIDSRRHLDWRFGH